LSETKSGINSRKMPDFVSLNTRCGGRIGPAARRKVESA
jgi:hypothetical protein